MLKSIQIKNFRLFRYLNIKPLNRVNLIAGENNSGKTAILEALYLLFGNQDSFERFASAFRSSHGPDDFESFWKWLSYQKKLKEPICLGVTDPDISYTFKSDDILTYSLIQDEQDLRDSDETFTFDYFEQGSKVNSFSISKGKGISATNSSAGPRWPKMSVFSNNPSSPTEDAEYFNLIDLKHGGGERMAEMLRVIDPRLQKLKYSKPLGQQQPLVYADIGMEDLIPTTQLGQGFTRLLRLYSEILVAKSKIILIDEIENGIHYSAMPKVWKGIATIAREEDLQVFATTHSYECIRSAHEAFSSEPHYDLALHRLERAGDDVKAVTYDKTTLETSIDMNLEVR